MGGTAKNFSYLLTMLLLTSISSYINPPITGSILALTVRYVYAGRFGDYTTVDVEVVVVTVVPLLSVVVVVVFYD